MRIIWRRTFAVLHQQWWCPHMSKRTKLLCISSSFHHAMVNTTFLITLFGHQHTRLFLSEEFWLLIRIQSRIPQIYTITIWDIWFREILAETITSSPLSQFRSKWTKTFLLELLRLSLGFADFDFSSHNFSGSTIIFSLSLGSFCTFMFWNLQSFFFCHHSRWRARI